MPAAEVDSAALALAAVPAKDPALARRTAASLRAVTGPPALPWSAALELERASQMWSMRRGRLSGELFGLRPSNSPLDGPRARA